MNYGMPYQYRKPAQQVWAVGEQVKVGFLSLRIVGKTPNGWRLTNKSATKHYEFEPHFGLRNVTEEDPELRAAMRAWNS
jgi:hypothetical protein